LPDYASLLRQLKISALDGNYPQLNGLGFGDDFGRNSCPRRRFLWTMLRKQEKIHSPTASKDLTTTKAGLKYREIPANPFPPRVFDEGIVSDL